MWRLDRSNSRSSDWATNALIGSPAEDIVTFQSGLLVKLIATDRKDLRTCTPQEDVTDVVKRNAEDQFDYFPVVEGDRIVGLIELIPFMRGEEPTRGRVRDRTIPLSEANLIGADASILSFVRDADHQHCRLVVSQHKISGLVSLADLQRLPVRAALFAMVTYLEMTMVEAIRRESSSSDVWMNRLSNDRLANVHSKIENSKTGDAFVDELLFTEFKDKTTILKKSSLFQWSKRLFESEMSQVRNLRDCLAHANDYAATRDMAVQVCQTVRKMDEWIERLTHWPPS